MKKIDMDKLRKREVTQREQKTKNDPRYVNYYDLKEGETMTIRILPDGGDSGSFYREYSTHGAKIPGMSKISCSKNGDTNKCSICQKSWELHDAGDDDAAAPWRANQHYIAQCVVVDSPIEIPANPEGGIVKLLQLPFQMYDALIEGILNETVEDPFDLENGNMFIIKKTKQGTYNRYDKSHWQAKPSMVPLDILEQLADEDTNPLYDLATLVPPVVSEAEVQEWITQAEEKLDENANSTSNQADNVATGKPVKTSNNASDNSDRDDVEPEPEPEADKKSTGSSALDLLNKVKKANK